MIVVIGGAAFPVQHDLRSARGVVVRWVHRRAFERKVRRQHLLRAIYEWLEGQAGELAATAAHASDQVLHFARHALVVARTRSAARSHALSTMVC